MAVPLDFWFDFASPYAYLSAMRIRVAAAGQGVAVTWRPFLLGPLFRDQGWETSPFKLYPAKGAYMWRDVARRAAYYGLAFDPPDAARMAAFPQDGLHAARLALVGLEQGWGEDFCRAVFHAQFADGADIGDPARLAALAAAAGAGDDATAAARTLAVKARLRASVAEARAAGIFGAPAFLVAGEHFWGDDRLEDALAWAGAGGVHRSPPMR